MLPRDHPCALPNRQNFTSFRLRSMGELSGTELRGFELYRNGTYAQWVCVYQNQNKTFHQWIVARLFIKANHGTVYANQCFERTVKKSKHFLNYSYSKVLFKVVFRSFIETITNVEVNKMANFSSNLHSHSEWNCQLLYDIYYEQTS